jgi:FKBP-type peptidyl-prolyl cis-trans isomerase 2
MIQKGDFVKLTYTGRLSDGAVFDTNDAAVAKKEGLAGTKEHKPITICVGERMLVQGLDDELVGRSGTFTVTLKPEHAFGKKDPKLLRIIPTKQLLDQKIQPHIGLRLNIDGNYGIVRSVAPGRTVVDFNHPLASQEVTYDVNVLEIVDDLKAQVQALLVPLHLHEEVTVQGDAVTIKLPQLLPKPLLDAIQNKITALTKIKTVSFEQGQQPARQTAATPAEK